jgi:hypothetical protein
MQYGHSVNLNILPGLTAVQNSEFSCKVSRYLAG